MKSYLVILSLVLGFMWSCNDSAKTTETDSTEVVTTNAPATSLNQPSYPSIPKETMELLWQSCTQIDYIFTNLPYSISTSDSQQSRGMLMHVSTQAATVDVNCPLTANVVYLASGEIVLEANLYFSEAQQCRYMVFLEDGQPKYANYLTPEAVGYFEKLISSVQVVPQK